MNLLLFNLVMDADDPVLGHTTPMVNALAHRWDHVDVITMVTGRVAVEDNVTIHSLGKERGWSEPRRLLQFYRLVYRIMRERRIDACFAHMAPLFALLFSPAAKRGGIPTLLWYAHPSVHPTMRMAHAVADRCVTSTDRSFRLPSDKLFVVGQGIDIKHFEPPTQNGSNYERTMITVGRITPIKRIEEMIEAVAILRDRGLELDLQLFGGPSLDSDRRYEASLKQLAADRDVAELVTFNGPVSFEKVPAAYHRGALFLNFAEGALDKAILESMASGCITVSRNASFEEIAHANGLEYLVPEEGATSVADRVMAVVERPDDERAEIATRLRRIVVEQHSLDRLADRITDHLHELVELRASARRPLDHA